MLLRLAVVSTHEGARWFYLGIDWAEAQHAVCLLDEAGARLGKARVPDGIEGLAHIHELVGTHTSNPRDRVAGIETDRGLPAQGLVAAGYQVCPEPLRCESLPRPSYRVASKVGSGRRQGVGRVGPHRSPEPSPVGWRQRACGKLESARPHPSDLGVGPRPACQSAAQFVARVLPRCTGRAGHEFGRAGTHSRCSAEQPCPSKDASSRSLSPAKPSSVAAASAVLRLVPSPCSEHSSPQLQPPTRLASAYGSSVLALVRVLGEFNAQIATPRP